MAGRGRRMSTIYVLAMCRPMESGRISTMPRLPMALPPTARRSASRHRPHGCHVPKRRAIWPVPCSTWRCATRAVSGSRRPISSCPTRPMPERTASGGSPICSAGTARIRWTMTSGAAIISFTPTTNTTGILSSMIPITWRWFSAACRSCGSRRCRRWPRKDSRKPWCASAGAVR